MPVVALVNLLFGIGFALIATGPFASEILLGSVTIGAVVIDSIATRRT